MFVQEAGRMGYAVTVYSPDANTPAGRAGAREITAQYTDFGSLEKFLDSVRAVSFEFENIPEACLDFLETYATKRKPNFFCPSPHAIRIAQNRIREKEHFHACGLPTVKFLPITTGSEDFSQFPFPAILKTNRWGYDGKGQRKFASPQELSRFFEENPIAQTEGTEYILEAVFPFDREISVIYARDQHGREFIFPPAENTHKNQILDLSVFPADLPESLIELATTTASTLGRSLKYHGVFGLEFFVADGKVLSHPGMEERIIEPKLVLNEFAPRPHNSGHFSQDGSLISQFGLQVRILTGQNLPPENQLRPTVMKNILGDNYSRSIELAIGLQERDPRYRLHLYEKETAKPGRKMGHLNFLGKLSEADPDFFDV